MATFKFTRWAVLRPNPNCGYSLPTFTPKDPTEREARSLPLLFDDEATAKRAQQQTPYLNNGKVAKVLVTVETMGDFAQATEGARDDTQ